MRAERLDCLDAVDRRDISPEELDELARVVFEPSATSANTDDAKDPVTDFLETFLTDPQMEAFEKATEGSIVSKSKEATLWPRLQKGILWHPAIISKLVALLEIESLDDINEPAWKAEGACREDMRFVSAGSHRTLKKTRQLMDVCEDCPVLAECKEHVAGNFLQYGFWAGVARSKGTGYHDDGTPVTLEERREMMDARGSKA